MCAPGPREETARDRVGAGRGAVLAVLALPSAAAAHAYLVRTVPAASVVLESPPASIQLTYDEAVEPRLAIISVTDEQGRQETTGPVHRAPANPDTLVVPLRAHLPEGWYLIYWRAISVDGHPVQGAFTYAVGPSPGPAPQFGVPNISATATTPQLLIARWVMFMTVMVAIGLFVLRLLIARPLVRRISGLSLRPLTVAFAIAAGLGLVAIPVYLDFSTANDSLRSVFDLTALVPLYRVTAFGRAIVDLELCFALFCVAAGVALWVDRPGRERRSIAELIAGCGAVLAAAAVLVVPGAAGHAAQTSPRGLTLLFDWLHLTAGSVWLGGLIGVLVLWFSVPVRLRVPALSACVPRFSNVALGSVAGARSHGCRRGRSTTCRPSTRCGRPGTARDPGQDGPARRRAVDRVRQSAPLATQADRGEPRAGPRRTGGTTVAPAGQRRSRDRRRGGVRGGGSLQPPSAAAGVRARELGHRKGRPRTRRPDRQPRRLLLQVLVSPNKAAAPDSFALRITEAGSRSAAPT